MGWRLRWVGLQQKYRFSTRSELAQPLRVCHTKRSIVIVCLTNTKALCNHMWASTCDLLFGDASLCAPLNWSVNAFAWLRTMVHGAARPVEVLVAHHGPPLHWARSLRVSRRAETRVLSVVNACEATL